MQARHASTGSSNRRTPDRSSSGSPTRTDVHLSKQGFGKRDHACRRVDRLRLDQSAHARSQASRGGRPSRLLRLLRAADDLRPSLRRPGPERDSSLLAGFALCRRSTATPAILSVEDNRLRPGCSGYRRHLGVRTLRRRHPGARTLCPHQPSNAPTDGNRPRPEAAWARSSPPAVNVRPAIPTTW
jgi:hypothetical protein